MFVRMPALTDAERVAHAKPIDWAAVRLSPEDIFTHAGPQSSFAARPGEIRLQQWQGEPVYRFSVAGKSLAFSAANGLAVGPVDQDRAVRVAAEFSGHNNAQWLETLERDRWTVTSRYNPYRPLHRIAIPDGAGTELYVSAATGEVVLDTTRSERFWNGLGAVTHWFYITALRSDQRLWESVILWTSGAGIAVAISGLWLGLQRLRRSRWTPYRGWMAWHHIAGLLGGLPLLTWIFSGWLSVAPLPLSEDGLLAILSAKTHYSRPGETAFPLTGEARDAFAEKEIDEARMLWESGKPVVLLTDRENHTAPFAPDTGQHIHWTDAELFDAMQRALPTARLTQRIRLEQEDRYWYSHREQRRLPVLRGVFDDAAATWMHIDPTTGELLQLMNRDTRTYRWLFNALHSLDFPWLIQFGTGWQCLLVVLSGMGLIISVTGVILGWRRLRSSCKG